MQIRQLLLSAFVLAALGACSPKSGSDSKAPTPAPAAGTSSVGGGGNGLDNKTLESYAIRIDTLPEYKRYIEPVIHRISRGRGDVITAYMNWTVQQKPWFLIPRPLAEIPQDQLGVGFQTDQLALHSDAKVFIQKSSYLAMNQKERANLLMHEIVMGARLLMKKTPKEQCEKLAGSQVEECSDPEMMKLADAQDIDDKSRGVMDDHDHDAVRAMTIFLMERTQEVSADSVRTERRQLGIYLSMGQSRFRSDPRRRQARSRSNAIERWNHDRHA